MNKLLRRILIAFILVLAALLTLIFTLNPNYLKPLIVEQVAQRGLHLQLAGDLKWQFFPRLGLGLGAVQLQTVDQQTSLLSVEQAHLSVRWGPLLQRQIQVSGLVLKGVKAQYHLNAQGQSPWDALTANTAAASQTTSVPPTSLSAPTPNPSSSTASSLTESTSNAAAFNIETLDIQEVQVDYQDAASKTQGEFLIHTLQAQQFNLKGHSFPAKLDVHVHWNDQLLMQLQWQGDVQLDLEHFHLKLENSDVKFNMGEAQIPVNFSTDVIWSPKLLAKGSLGTPKQALAPLAQAFSIASPQMPQQGGFDIQYEYTDNQATLKPFNIKIDDTQFIGELNLTQLDKALPSVQLQLQGDQIDLNRYLSSSTQAVDTQTSTNAQSAEDVALPMSLLRTLDLHLDISLQKALYKTLDMTQAALQIKAQAGLIKLNALRVMAAEGVIEGQGQLDARGPEAQLGLKLNSNAINLGVLLKALAQFDKITGKASANMTLQSSGKTTQALNNQLTATIKAQSEELALVPINIEEQFCKALALLQQATEPEKITWPEQTRLTPVNIHLEYAQHKLILKEISAQIARLTSRASGELDMATGAFKIPVALSLSDFAAGDAGCLPVEAKWRARSLPLVCKGDLNHLGAKTCLPDTAAIGDLIKDTLKAQAKVKLDAEKDRAEDRLKTQAKDKLREKLSEEKLQAAEESVRNLLKSFKKPKSSAASSSATTTASSTSP